MGVNLKPLIERNTVTIKELKGQIIAVDAPNVLHQFLSTIRKPDGSLLTDSDGNVTSHLVGLFYRTVRLMNEFSIKPVYVFDGEMPLLKKGVIEERLKIRKEAEERSVQAREAGNIEKALREAVRSIHLNEQMLKDAERLLRLLGLPTVQAPGEAEAQCAYMTRDREVYAMNSRDYDSLLFGAEKLLRHLTISTKENVEIIILEDFLKHHGITLEQLVDMGILIGTDYNDGVFGVGPKTSLKLIKQYDRIENIPKKYIERLDVEFRDVRRLFLEPPTTSDYELKFRDKDKEGLLSFLCEERGFPKDRVLNNLTK